MLTIHEIGAYSVTSSRVLDIYMVEDQGGQRDGAAEYSPAQVSYCLDINGKSELLFWSDWLSFAHAVNALAPINIVDPLGLQPAEELGLIVQVRYECPNCGCRVMDALEWINDQDILCHGCSAIYTLQE